nr:GNAT family N-acetyltransferase [Riemerella columbina]
MNPVNFNLATIEDIDEIWQLLQLGIEKRRRERSNQWQDGYPNLETVKRDVNHQCGFVLKDNEVLLAYMALIKNNEPAYQNIEGQWLSDGDFVVLHRLIVNPNYAGQGLAKKAMLWAEDWAKQQQIDSLKVDTNFDNEAMLHIFKTLGYTYCGKVYFRGSPRQAFEKRLS